jgi:hypothetical protein
MHASPGYLSPALRRPCNPGSEEAYSLAIATLRCT